MAVVTADAVSKTAVALLTRSIVLPNTVTRVAEEEFTGTDGDVIVRVPQPASGRVQASPGATITYDDVNEESVLVTLKHLYYGTKVTDQVLSYSLVNFAEQITKVQVDAVAAKAEAEVAAAMNALPASAITFATSATEADTKAKVLAARAALSKNDAPATGRYLAVSPDIATRLLSVADFTRADAVGDGDALTEAILGRILGFTVVESNALTANTAVAYHESGFVFANKTPVAPSGAKDAASMTANGIGLRQIFDYDPSVGSDVSLVSTFAGAAAVGTPAATPVASNYKRAIKLTVA